MNSSLNVSSGKSMKVYVANSSDCIYLPPASSASFTYEDVENGGRPDEEVNLNAMNENVMDRDLIDLDSNVTQESLNASSLQHLFQSFESPNFLCSKVEADCPIPHTFAVIIELNKEHSVKDLRIKFQSLVSILWPSGDPYNKGYSKEKFKIGSMEWKTSFDDADYYINTSNTSDVKSKEITLSDLIARTRSYKLTGNAENTEELSASPNNNNFSNTNTSEHEDTSDEYCNVKEGLYVFLLPILIPEHVPQSISSINGSLVHNLAIQFLKNSNKLSRKLKISLLYDLPMVRTPPSFANSIADKPIYVNRVWNDSLHYTITFPKKYVSLGSEHQINLKLVPLVKDVIIKRIKFNVLERITYVSKSLSREHDYDSEDPFYLRPILPDGKIRERVVPICELKTKAKTNTSGPEPYKEEVIKCPDNNLLFSCYEAEARQSEDVMIASPLDINIALPFLTTKSDKFMQTNSGGGNWGHDNELNTDTHGSSHSGLDSPGSSYTPNKRNRGNSFDHSNSSPVIGSLETNIHHANVSDFYLDPSLGASHIIDTAEQLFTPDSTLLMGDEHIGSGNSKENIHAGYTSISKALYPDSNFRHIQIQHRLQVCFRISKPDPSDNYKVHHYEVVVDTPLILLSAKCNEESIQLPQYDEVDHQFPFEIDDHIPTNQGEEVTFRTPNYVRNGISIKPLYTDEDQLPSFEEATSSPGSPMTRSVSFGDTDPISRIPSSSDPAPAYVYGDSEAIIDEIVQPNRSSVSLTSTSPSKSTLRIRSSLLNSFAPALSVLQDSSKDDSVFEPVTSHNESETTGDILEISSNHEGTPITSSESNGTNEIESSNESASATSNDSTSTNDSVMFVSDGQEVSTVGSSNSAIDGNEPTNLISSNVNQKHIPTPIAIPSTAPPAPQRNPSTRTLSSNSLQGNAKSFITTTTSTNGTSSSESYQGSIKDYDPVYQNRPQPRRNDTGHSSIFTVDSSSYNEGAPISTTNTLNFDQGLPLLENYSIDELNRTFTQMSTNTNLANDKSDNLSIVTADQMQADGQNEFHAY